MEKEIIYFLSRIVTYLIMYWLQSVGYIEEETAELIRNLVKRIIRTTISFLFAIVRHLYREKSVVSAKTNLTGVNIAVMGKP